MASTPSSFFTFCLTCSMLVMGVSVSNMVLAAWLIALFYSAFLFSFLFQSLCFSGPFLAWHTSLETNLAETLCLRAISFYGSYSTR